MSEYIYNKIDFIIMICLALLVAFIIGFNIIQIVDSKLSSVVINVPPQNCALPPIYLNLDKDLNLKESKQLLLNDVLTNKSVSSNKSSTSTTSNESIVGEEFDNLSNKFSLEKFGDIQDYPLIYDDNRRHLISSIINSNESNKIINNKTIYEKDKDPNYNDINNIPLLVAPDTDVPNRAGPNAIGYYASKVKLIEDTNSPLMKLAKENANKINKIIAQDTLNDRTKIPEINGTFDAYNAFVDLRTDSYANITSIGKSMLTPYVSYPVPS